MWRLIPHVVPGKQKRPLSVVRSQIFHFASTDQAGICFSQGSLFAFTRWLDPCVLFTEVQVAWGDPSTLTIALPVYLRVACLCICKFVFLCICASHSAPSPLTTALQRICRPGQVVEVWGRWPAWWPPITIIIGRVTAHTIIGGRGVGERAGDGDDTQFAQLTRPLCPCVTPRHSNQCRHTCRAAPFILPFALLPYSVFPLK